MTQTPPFTLVGLDHIVFIVDDMKKALDFYQGVLGCVPGYSYPALGMAYSGRYPPGVGVVTITASPAFTLVWSQCFSFSSVPSSRRISVLPHSPSPPPSSPFGGLMRCDDRIAHSMSS
jgi:catechol 2,3-dioxygenase-like lactoylglutathione lyase family enzyme